MKTRDPEFLKRILQTFRAEAQEHLSALTTGFMELEKDPVHTRGEELVETLFRETHSLKGAARSVDQYGIESMCQALEGALSSFKQSHTIPPASLCNLFHRTVDHMAGLLRAPEGEAEDEGNKRQLDLMNQLAGAACETPSPTPPEHSTPLQKVVPAASSRTPQPQPEAPLPPKESLRISTDRLGQLLLQAEEMIQAKVTAAQRATAIASLLQELDDWKAELAWGARRALAHETMDSQARLSALQQRVESLRTDFAKDSRALKQMVDDHLAAMKQALMLPVGLAIDVLPKFVRDLAQEQGKEVDLVIQGAELEIDKRILDELKEPLIHLMRNSIDHGLRKAAERKAAGRPGRGAIILSFAAKDSRQVEITVADDGEGLDLAQVREAALSKNLITAEDAAKLDDSQIQALVFLSGLSTSPIVTDISGYGLGLAIVREKVEKLGGTIAIETSPQGGTTFRLLLPMTLATFRGVLVRVGEHHFLLPTTQVQRVLRVSRHAIGTVENRQTIGLENTVLSLVNLGDCLGVTAVASASPLPPSVGRDMATHVTAVVVAWAGQRMAFQVDEVLEEKQVLLKSLGRQLIRLRNIAGAAVLGDGGVVPVLNVGDLMISAVRAGRAPTSEPESKPAKASRILVAEDSITARALIKNILQTGGYQVTTAVDGLDAFTQAREGEFDLLVSDVDMPRMNGFELTAKIKSDQKLNKIPVVLVTALDSREDRERGIEVGADAYIVKSSFDQSNLLAVVRKLI